MSHLAIGMMNPLRHFSAFKWVHLHCFVFYLTLSLLFIFYPQMKKLKLWKVQWVAGHYPSLKSPSRAWVVIVPDSSALNYDGLNCQNK